MSNFAVLCTKAVRADGYRCVAHFTACMTVPASRRSKWSCTFVLHCRCDHLITHCTLNFAAFIVATQKVWLGHDRPHWFLHLWCGCLAGTCMYSSIWTTLRALSGTRTHLPHYIQLSVWKHTRFVWYHHSTCNQATYTHVCVLYMYVYTMRNLACLMLLGCVVYLNNMDGSKFEFAVKLCAMVDTCKCI